MLRGRAEEKLKQLNVQLESEVKIRTAELAESQRIGRMGHWVLDLAKDDLTWSDEIFRIFEIDPDRFGASYKAFLETIHPDDREAVDSAYTKSLYDKQPYDITHRLLFPDGRVKWVHEKCETKFDEKGIPLISRGTVQDITANKFVERKLSLTQYAMDHVSEAAFLLDKDGRFSYVNHSACTSFGYSRDELLAMSLGDVTHSLSPVSLPDRLASLKDTGTQRFETVYLRRDGQRLQVEIVADFLVFDDDEYVFAVARDISAIKEAQAEIERQHNLLQAVVDGVSDPIMMIDSDYNVGLMNRAARHTAPEFALALSQPKCYQVSHHANEPCTGNEHPCPLRDVFETGKTHRVEHEHPVGNHVEKIYQILANPMLDSEGEVIGVIESYRDVSEYRNLLEKLRENESRLAHIAHHDNLTGLPNRLLFVDRLQQAIIKARRSQSLIALMFLDLDRFKEVNDSYGHQVGDKLLSLASTRLRRHIREEDTAARIGGDEFTIILDSIDKAQDAGTVAEKLLLAFQQPFEIDDKTFFLTTSIGISIYPQDGTDANTLIRNADSAMYNAKEYGRNLFRYYREEMTATAMERVVMETSLRGALEQEAFELYYQPQIDMRSGELVGLEALVRWNHPQQGLLAPSKFIPMAEETGLILPIGEWILHQACQQARIWLDRGLNRSRISVNCNLSGRQIESEVFHHTVLKIIEETGIEPDLLELEITESSLMDDPQSSSRMLDKLCDIGVRLAIDDFGTGYSSLAYLKALPISTLKIDQSFVRDIMADTDDAAITRAVIALGSSLRMQVIAEGVETEEQAEFLLREGCHIGQGFLFARPMPALEFENYLLAMTEEYK
jgi:diguanylate cyclase (GGDEF)-like protein/PAS domain S-box-containing protein